MRRADPFERRIRPRCPGKAAVSEILGGPTNGSDNAYLIYTRMPPGAHGPSLFTLPVEDDYVVLSGKMTVQIGTEKFVAGPFTGVVIPPNIPHEVWNADAEPEANFEAISSANPRQDLSRNLMSMLKPAQPMKVANASPIHSRDQGTRGLEFEAGIEWSEVHGASEGQPVPDAPRQYVTKLRRSQAARPQVRAGLFRGRG